jgi:hypothetical protein
MQPAAMAAAAANAIVIERSMTSPPRLRIGSLARQVMVVAIMTALMASSLHCPSNAQKTGGGKLRMI